MIRTFGAVVVALALVVGMSATADPDSCREAIDQFRSARGDLAGQIRSYASCVSSSNGHDDCSSEFHSVQSSHDDFEAAVSEYESECS
jgi:hypothetical protein